MSQQHCLVSLRVIRSHVSSDSYSWLSVPRNPHMTCEKPTQTHIPENQQNRAWNTCIVYTCVCRLIFMLLQMHLWVDIWSFSCHWCAEGGVVHVGFSADSRDSETESAPPGKIFFALTIPLLAEITVLLGWRCWGAVFHPAKGGSTSLLAWAEWPTQQNRITRRPQVSLPVFYSSIVPTVQYCEVCVDILGKIIICMLLRKSKIVSLF